jgi:septation ring formation regulator EzrA
MKGAEIMGLFFWKKNKAIDVFASALADELYSTLQPELARNSLENQSRKSQQKMERKLRDITTRVNQFRETNSLGVYGKARLHLIFTERLKTLGYDKRVAETLNEKILLRTP